MEQSDDDFESKTVNRCLSMKKMSAKFPALANKLTANLMNVFSVLKDEFIFLLNDFMEDLGCSGGNSVSAVYPEAIL